MNFVFPVLALAVLTIAAALAWWLMARWPERWAMWVNRENDYWRAKGVMSQAGAERMKRWEKSWVLKWLAAATAIFGLVGLVITGMMLVRVLMAEHAKLRQPFDPKWYLRPPVQPKAPLLKKPIKPH